MDELIEKYNKSCDNYEETSQYYFEEGDTIYKINGIFFLIQNKGCFYNNVVAFRVEVSNIPLKETIKIFMKRCIDDEIYYLRVNSKLNRWLPLFKKLAKETDSDFIRDEDASNEIDRDIFYIKLCTNINECKII